MVYSIGIGFCVLAVKDDVTSRVYFLLGQSLYLAHSSVSLEHDAPHYSSESHEHSQLLVEAILGQMGSCEQRVWMLPDCSKIAGQKHRWRLKGCKEGDNKIIFLFFSHFMFLFN